MNNKNFKLFKKRDDANIIESLSLNDIFDDYDDNNEHWLFIAPHDDDVVIGAGLLLQKARLENIKVSVIITTDGSLGYTTEKSADTIVDVRKKETLDSFAMLDIDDVIWLDFPDASLEHYTGRRKANKNDPCIIKGYTGLENAYAHYLRKYSPTRVFIATGEDLHPDHKVVYNEVLISIFHASNGIWLELGEPVTIPKLYEMAVYCDFAGAPDIKIETTPQILEKKLRSIEAYKSQDAIIRKLVAQLKKGGPIEYFKTIMFNLYSPDNYKGEF